MSSEVPHSSFDRSNPASQGAVSDIVPRLSIPGRYTEAPAMRSPVSGRPYILRPPADRVSPDSVSPIEAPNLPEMPVVPEATDTASANDTDALADAPSAPDPEKIALVGSILGQPESRAHIARIAMVRGVSPEGVTDVDDVIQTATEKALKNANRIDTEKNILPYVGTIARRVITDTQRHESYIKTEPANIGGLEYEQPERAAQLIGQPDAPEVFDVTITTEDISDALNVLTDNRRQVVELFYRNDMNQAQIADHLGIPLGTVKTRMHNAISRLRDYYNDHGIHSTGDFLDRQ
jgi:RNA polymerase sigma factor (sigma-70 family)